MSYARRLSSELLLLFYNPPPIPLPSALQKFTLMAINVFLFLLKIFQRYWKILSINNVCITFQKLFQTWYNWISGSRNPNSLTSAFMKDHVRIFEKYHSIVWFWMSCTAFRQNLRHWNCKHISLPLLLILFVYFFLKLDFAKSTTLRFLLHSSNPHQWAAEKVEGFRFSHLDVLHHFARL